MAELREADLRALHALDEVLADLDDPEAFGPAVLAPVTTFVPCDYATYNEIDVHRRRAIAAVEPGMPSPEPTSTLSSATSDSILSSLIHVEQETGAPTPSLTFSTGALFTGPTSTRPSSVALGRNTKWPSP